MLAEQVAEARDVEAGRPPAVDVLVLVALDVAVGAEAEVVVHQVVTELARAAAQPAGPDVGRRRISSHVELSVDAQRKTTCAEYSVVCSVTASSTRTPRRALAVAVVEDVGHDRERLERQLPVAIAAGSVEDCVLK